MNEQSSIQLERDVFGRLLLHRPDGTSLPVRPVRLFPLTCQDAFIALLDHEEREVAMVRDLAGLDFNSRQALEADLESAYLVPQVDCIHDIREEFGVLQWHTHTDRGERRFDVRGRDEIHFVDSQHLLIRDIDGNRFEIRNVNSLDHRSQALIDAYL